MVKIYSDVLGMTAFYTTLSLLGCSSYCFIEPIDVCLIPSSNGFWLITPILLIGEAAELDAVAKKAVLAEVDGVAKSAVF